MSPVRPGSPSLSVVHRDGTALVLLGGDVDVAAAGPLETEILEQVDDAPAVVVDLSAVAFLDSAGLRLLDHLVGACDRRGAPVRLVAAEGSPARLPIALCGFRDGLLTASSTEALQDLTRARS